MQIRPVAWLAPALLWSCGSGDGATAPPVEAPNVLLIVVDTLGAEHVGCYSDGLDHTPNIDGLAAEGKRFQHAYAPAPWTQPSMASLFTGQMPSKHLVRGLLDVLSEDSTTLAELLGEAGYTSHGIVSNQLLATGLGYGQGFDTYSERAVEGHDGITSEKVTNQAIRWLENRASEPFFLFAHYFDPHALYHHHPEFERTEDYQGPLTPAMGIWETRDLRPELTPTDVEYLVDLHREEIAFTDHQIGRLLAHLRESGLDESTLVVLTSDHGEEFMRHGWIGHTRTLYDELIRIPLIIALPGVIPPGVVETPASLIDIAPTIAATIGAESEDWDGLTLWPDLLSKNPGRSSRPLFAEVSFAPKLQEGERAEEKTAFKTAVILDDFKLIHDEATGRLELFDKRRDIHDEDDLWEVDSDRASRLAEILRDWEGARPAPLRPSDSWEIPAGQEALMRELEDLGYVEGVKD